jgi:hypothetical protein
MAYGSPQRGERSSLAAVPADDFSDCFDFNQTPLPFQTISSPLNVQYFLNDKTSPTDPDDD